MPPPVHPGQQSPPRNSPDPPPQAINSNARFSPDAAGMAPTDQRHFDYQPQQPIRFYDDEVKRMHTELDKRAHDDRVSARRAIRNPSRPRRKGVTLTDFCTRVALLYLAIAFFIVCPTDTTRDRAVCRQLDRAGATLRAYEPTLRPYYDTAQRKISPYVAELQHAAEPVVAKVRPHVARVDALTRPYLAQLAQHYRAQVHPRLASGIQRSQVLARPYVDRVKQQYTKTLAPSVEWYSDSLAAWYAATVEPHLSRATSLVRHHSKTAYDAVSPAYYKGVPLAQHHLRTHVVPFSRRTYAASRRTYVKHVHPRAITVGRHAGVFYRARVLPALQRFWSRFIAPQLDKISERVFEYKAKKAKQEALARVEKKTEEIVKDAGDDNLEEFIKDLRDAAPAAAVADSLPPSDPLATPALPDDAPPAYSSSVPPPPPSAEDAALQRAEKRAALEALQATYEREIAALGQAEHALLVDRLAAIRQHALGDVPRRFDASMEMLDEEGDKMVGRLGRYFDRVAEDAKMSTEEKVEEADVIGKRAAERLENKAKAVKGEVEEYRAELEAKEKAAVEQAQQAVSALVAKAQSELGVGWTWLEDVTAKDWQRYHALRKADQNLAASFSNLQTGAIKDASLAKLDPYALLDEYASQPDGLVTTFTKILDKIKVKGQRELKGEWLGVVPEAQKAYDAVSGKFGAVVADLKESASSVAGVEKKPTNVAQSVSSLAKAAQASASSVAQEALNALPTIEAHQEYVAAVKSAVGDASQNVLRAVGVEPVPTNMQQTASSLARAASSSAAHAYAEASQSALRALGREPSPTDLPQSLSSIAHVASASASAAYSQVLSDYPSSISSALAAATQAVDRVAEDALSSAGELAASAASVVSSLAAPAATMLNPAPVAAVLEGAKAQVNEFFGDVSQDVLKAVRQEPSPTDLRQTAESVAHQAKSTLDAVASKAASLASPHSDFAASSNEVKKQAQSTAKAAQASASSLSKRAEASTASMKKSASSASSAASQVAQKRSSSLSKSASSASAAASTTTGALKRSAASLASQASQQVHDATRTTPEGVKETASSLISAASASASSLSSAASSLAQPHPAYSASRGTASVKSAASRVSSAASSAASVASSKVHDATRTTAEGVKETVVSKVKEVKEQVEGMASPHPSYRKSQAQASVASATDRVKKAVVHGEL
ncbi:hypothetical protein JCM10207_008101 [Rhodosporidiobolus poonsookiae]